MASVNLTTIGTALGKTGAITLEGVQLNGYTRTYSVAATDYKRVNPFQVEAGQAGDPASGAPYNLTDWEGYAHWDASSALNFGTSVDVTARDEDEVSLSWTLPAGWTRNLAGLILRIYYKACTGECDETDDPRSGGSSTDGANDASSFTVTGLSAFTRYIFAVVTRWNDDDTVHESELFDTVASLAISGGGVIESAGEAGAYVWMRTTEACNSWAAGSGSNCALACDDFFSAGTVFARGSLTSSSAIYTESSCSTSVTTALMAWDSGSADECWTVVGGTVGAFSETCEA